MCAKNNIEANREEKPLFQKPNAKKKLDSLSKAYGTMTTSTDQPSSTPAVIKFNDKTQLEETNINKKKNDKRKQFQRQNTSRSLKDVPDGGWGWVVVLGVSISNMTTQALVSVYGFLFSQRLAELEINTSGAAIILSTQTAILNFSGLITGPLIRRYSYQKVALTGALLMVSGLLLTTMANSLVTYSITYGVFTGLGLGCLYPATFVAVNTYFSAKKSVAVGWSLTGTGIGQMLLPLLCSYLLDEFGFRGTILILAGISSHAIMAALLYHPVKWHLPSKRMSASKGNLSKNDKPLPLPVQINIAKVAGLDDSGVKTLAIRKLSESKNRSESSLQSIAISDDEETVQTSKNVVPNGRNIPNSPTEEKLGVWAKIRKIFDIDLLKSGSFLNMIIGSGVVYSSNTSFQMLYPLFLTSLNYTSQEVALCMSALSAADIVGRPLLPYITRIFHLRSKTIFFVSALFSAIARSILATQSKMVIIIVMATFCGLFRSAIIINTNLSVAEQTTSVKLPAALGMQMVFKGLGTLALGPLVGWIRDHTQSYSLCIHILGLFFLVLPFLTWLLERLILNCRS